MLINFSEAARILQVSRQTIYNMIARGEITVIKIADRQFIIKKELEKLLDKVL